VTEKRQPADGAAGPPNFGLPEHSALTIEGRIERTAAAASHVVRARDGRERRLRSSSWAGGLWLIAGALGVLVVVMVALYLIG
jgi:hypothetical protein